MLKRVVPMLFAAVLLLAVSGFAAQEAESKPAADDQTTKGELIAVDAQTSTFVIRLSDDSEMKFRYDANTVVTGGDEGVAGLAANTGSVVTVHYQAQDSGNLATRIEI